MSRASGAVPRSHYVVAILSVAFVLVVLPILVISATDWSRGREPLSAFASLAAGALLMVSLTLGASGRREGSDWVPGPGLAVATAATGAALSAIGGIWRLVALSFVLGVVASFAVIYAVALIHHSREGGDR